MDEVGRVAEPVRFWAVFAIVTAGIAMVNLDMSS